MCRLGKYKLQMKRMKYEREDELSSQRYVSRNPNEDCD